MVGLENKIVYSIPRHSYFRHCISYSKNIKQLQYNKLISHPHISIAALGLEFNSNSLL